MSHGFTATRADHVGGHVAMAVVPYFPNWAIPLHARKRFQPWACTFHTPNSDPSHFIAFGWHAGMVDAVCALLGPLLLKMHGGLFETLAERVEIDLDNSPLQSERLALVADAPEVFVASPSFAVDCYLAGADPHRARLHLETMRAAVKNHRSLVL